MDGMLFLNKCIFIFLLPCVLLCRSLNRAKSSRALGIRPWVSSRPGRAGPWVSSRAGPPPASIEPGPGRVAGLRPVHISKQYDQWAGSA